MESSGSDSSEDSETEHLMGDNEELLEEDEETQRTEIRKELSNLTFEELEALKAKMGIKMYNEAMFGSNSSGSSGPTSKVSKSKKSKRQEFKRGNKNRPRELPSRVRVDKVRKVTSIPTKKPSRDPRFEDSCGQLDEKIWKTNYSFLTDLAKEEESTLKEKLKEENVNDEEKLRIKSYLQKLANKTRSIEEKEKVEEKLKQEKAVNVQRMKEGKRPYFVKKSTRKYLELSEKYDELKAKGKLESYLKKKRKKNAIRDKKAVTL